MADNHAASDALDKDSRKRLEKLTAQWGKPPGQPRLTNLTLPDLRLLLGHFPPLQELIRQNIAPEQHIATIAEDRSSAEHEPAVEQLRTQLQQSKSQLQQVEDKLQQAQAQLQDSQIKLQEVEKELYRTQAEFNQAQTELQQTDSRFNHLASECEATQRDLVASNAAVQKLQNDGKKREEALEKTQDLLRKCQAMQKPVPPELTLLRIDQNLARRLDLSDLPSDDTQALIQTVAVLAQRENLERLWSALKERCEAENRSASAPERSLLETALLWHNHNWRTRPYRLMEVVPPSAYHFEKHLRSRQTPTGETVVALDLPGIADGNNNPLCKTLVRTR